MKLYHFTAQHHLDGGAGHPGPGILHAGIRPTIHPYIDVAGGMVWLTDDPSWSQPWSTRAVPVPGYGPCNRTEVRIEVAIPRASRRSLGTWRQLREFVLTEGLARDMERYANPDRWFVYAGIIPRGWIRSIERRSVAVAS